MTNIQTLDQEKLEIYILENTPDILFFSIEEIFNLGVIKNEIDKNYNIVTNWLDLDIILSMLPYPNKNLKYEETVDYYINALKNLPWYNVLCDMKNRTEDIYIQYTHQKTFVKWYFVPLLQQIFDFCDKEEYIQMAYAMLYNIKDESWNRQESKHWNTYSKKWYNYPIVKPWEEYKWEPHFMRRKYEYEWLIREYWKKINKERNSWVKIFNYLLWKLLINKSRKWEFMKIWAIAAAEKIIPDEYIYMKEARNRLFPRLNQKERHYIDDHIKHDIEYHFEDIKKWIDEIKLSDEEEWWIKEWMHLFFIWRASIYSSFREQIHN